MARSHPLRSCSDCWKQCRRNVASAARGATLHCIHRGACRGGQRTCAAGLPSCSLRSFSHLSRKKAPTAMPPAPVRPPRTENVITAAFLPIVQACCFEGCFRVVERKRRLCGSSRRKQAARSQRSSLSEVGPAAISQAASHFTQMPSQ